MAHIMRTRALVSLVAFASGIAMLGAASQPFSSTGNRPMQGPPFPGSRLPATHRAAPVLRVRMSSSTLVVTTTADTLSPCPQNAVSLRCAIDQANADGSGDTIAFAIPASDLGCAPQTIQGMIVRVCTIKVTVNTHKPNGLALTASNTVIDGYSQPGSHPNTNAMGSGAGDNAILTVDLDGKALSVGRDGIVLLGPYETVKGLAITNFRHGFVGINVFNDHEAIVGNFIGVAPDGKHAKGNDAAMFVARAFTQIGGAAPASANVIGGNVSGILINGGSSGSGTVVEGNYINTTADGSASLGGNGGPGLDISFTPGLRLGGTTADQRNVVVGGISARASQDVVIEGNYIGTDAKGRKPLGGGSSGIIVRDGGSQVLIGGAVAGAGNLISGNSMSGVYLFDNSSGTIVQGNLIGTDRTGAHAVPNGASGISIVDSFGNTVGGATPAQRNIISGNTSAGVFISDGSSNKVQGNYIGTDFRGGAALPNGSDGSAAVSLITENTGNTDNLIGGSLRGEGNVISGNLGDGVDLNSDSTQLIPRNIVDGNVIGMTAGAKNALGNAGNGVFVGNGMNGAAVGNAMRRSGNVIAFNGLSGVLIGAVAADRFIHVAVHRNRLFQNGGLGIDLAPQGAINCSTVPPGPNDYAPCPQIAAATTQQIRGTACAGCLVEVFVATGEPNDLSHGEGKVYLGMTLARNGGAWKLKVGAGQVSPGDLVTATATKPGTSNVGAETSEFAANVTVTQ